MSSDLISFDATVPLLPRQLESQVKTQVSSFESFVNGSINNGAAHFVIGAIVGTTFTALVSCFSNDVLAPIISIILPSSLDEQFWTLRRGPKYPYQTKEDAKADHAITLNIGMFIQQCLVFILTAVFIYTIAKVLSNVYYTKTTPASKKRQCHYCYTEVDSRSTICCGCLSPLLTVSHH